MRKHSALSVALFAAVLLPVGVPLSGAETAAPTVDELHAALKRGEIADVERRCRALLDELEGGEPADPLDVARVLDVLVESLWRGGKSERAETSELADRAVRIKEEALGPDHVELAASLDNVGHVLRSTGRYVEAKQYFERALQIREAALGSEDPHVGRSLNQLGWVLYSIGEFDRAEAAYERSLKILKTALGDEHPDLAPSLNNLAILLKTLGDYSGSRSMYEQVLEIQENKYGENHRTVASALNNLAILVKNQGDYAAAIPLYERAIRVGTTAWGPDHPTVAQFVNNLAALYKRMGDYPSAQRLHQRALEILEKKEGSDHPQVATVLNNLGGLLSDAGMTEQAKPLLERALGIREKAYGAGNPLVARVLNNLGHLHVQVGEYPTATDLYSRSLAVVEQTLGADHPDTANVLEKLGDVLHRKGEYDASRERFEQALGIYEATLGNDHPKVAGCLRALSALSIDAGDTTAALDLALQADEIGREHLLLTARTLPERQALAYALARPAGEDLAFSVLANEEKISTSEASRVWNASIRSRALVLDEMRVRHQALSQAEEPARRLARASERLANLLVRGPGKGPTEQYRQLLLGAKDERDRAERALAEASLSFRRTKEATKHGFEEVAAALPAKSALVAFVRYARRLPSGAIPSYMAMVLRRGAEPTAIPVGSGEEIEALVARWRKEIAAARSRVPMLAGAGDARYRKVSQELRRVVWDPIAKHVEGSDRVFVVPDGGLQVVNLATLAGDDDTYLIESAPPIHYLSTERDLVNVGSRSTSGRGLLVAAGPDFGSAEDPAESKPGTDCVDFDSIRFPLLPGTIKEVDAVASLWTSMVPEGPAARVSRLQGPAATEDAFKQRAKGHQVIHLATHGFFVGERCGTGSSGGRADSEGTIRSLAPPTEDDTTILSGLALADANLRHTSDLEGSDGILTAQEIASIDLTGVDWVVLSACDTGLGTIRAGEGVFGLRRAFQIAGAETLIMSLWAVEDASNRAWMRRLYEARLGGLGSAEAVHRAGLGVLQTRRRDRQSTHPFYWGAFIAVGDWR